MRRVIALVALASIGAQLSGGGSLPARAQAAPPEQAIAGGTPLSDRPLLFIVLQREAVPQKDDPGPFILSGIREVLEDSSRYQIVTFNINSPFIKRALSEKVFMADDLMMPLRPDVILRLGRLFNAQYILTLKVDRDKETLKTDTQLRSSISPTDWRVVFGDLVNTPGINGGKRLKSSDQVALTVDAIADRMGVPSHRAAVKFAQENGKVIKKGRPEPKEKPEKTKADAPPANGNPAGAAQTAIPDSSGAGTVVSDKTSPAVTNPDPTDRAGSRPVNPQSPKSSIPDPAAPRVKASSGSPKTTKTNSGRAAAPAGSPDKRGGEGAAPQVRSSNPKSKTVPRPPTDPIQTARNTNDGVSGNTLPPDETPNLNGAAAAPKQDWLGQADRFHKAGDLINAIVFLRRAVNDSPADLSLRRQLIQLYQERKMPDAAMDEIGRTLTLDPKDSSLYRLYGDSLLSKNDAEGALKAYRQAAEVDPNDVQARIAIGDALSRQGRYDQANAAYQEAIKADPKSPQPWRRLALAAANRAAVDPKYYADSLNAMQQARTLASADTEGYQDDYIGLMQLLGAQMRELLDQLGGQETLHKTMQSKLNDLLRESKALKEQAQALDDYLNKLPTAAGQESAHSHYEQASALVIQAISQFRDALPQNDDSIFAQSRDTMMDARRELTDAEKRLLGTRAALAPKNNGK